MIFGALVLLINFVRPAYDEAQLLKGEFEAKKIALENQRRVLSQVNELKAKYQGDTELEQVIGLSLPAEKEESELVHMVHRLAELNNIAVQSVAVNAGAITATKEGKEVSIRPVGTIQLSLRFSGTYEGLKSFLQNLETNVRIMDVQTIGINPPAGTAQNSYLFDAAVVTYYQGE